MGLIVCQSCAMPMNKDPQGGATLNDGTRSTDYCSLCMSDGEFHFTGSDVKAFQKMVVAKMSESGWWRPIAWLATRSIPKLNRWNTK